MSVLTKVFVVLVNVLSVALVALVIAFVANTENFKQQFTEVKAERDSFDAKARLIQGELNLLKGEWDKQAKTYADEINAKLAQAKAAEDQLATVRAELAGTRRDTAKLEAQVSGLSAAMSQNQAILDAALKELAQRRDDAVKLETRAIQLADRNNELMNQVEAYNRQVRRLNEQMTQLDEEKNKISDLWTRVPQDVRDRLTQTTAAAAAGVVEAVQTAVPVRGQITKIETVGDQTFAQINLGKTDKVAPNTKFMIYRDNKFMGNLIIMTVSDREAVGRVELNQVPLSAGDRVMSGVF